MKQVTWVVVYGQCVGRRYSIYLGRYATEFQAEIYAILACAYEIQINVEPQKYILALTARQI
jgi:hypothetical protein